MFVVCVMSFVVVGRPFYQHDNFQNIIRIGFNIRLESDESDGN